MPGPLVALLTGLRSAGPALAQMFGTGGGAAAGAGAKAAAAGEAASIAEAMKAAGAVNYVPGEKRKVIELENPQLVGPPTAKERQQQSLDAMSVAAGAAIGAFSDLKDFALKPSIDSFISLAMRAKNVGTMLATFGPGVLESRRELARYSGQIAETFAKLDRQTILLDIRRARYTAESASQLGAAVLSLRNNLAPLENEGARLVNNIGKMSSYLGSIGAISLERSPIFTAIRLQNSYMESLPRALNRIAEFHDRGIEALGGSSTWLQDLLKSLGITPGQRAGATHLDFVRQMVAGNVGAKAQRPDEARKPFAKDWRGWGGMEDIQ